MTSPTHLWYCSTQLNDLGGGSHGLCAGDLDGSGIISVTDFNGYVAHLAAMNTYTPADFDLDSQVTISDFNKYRPNASRIGVLRVRY